VNLGDTDAGVDPISGGDASGGSNNGGGSGGQSGPGQSGGNASGGNGSGGNGGGTTAGDYRQPGSHSVTRKVSSFQGEVCTFETESFVPDQAETDQVVILAPGFAFGAGLGSTREAMSPLAEHFASWGITTYTVALCTNGPSIDHPRNGQAIAELGESVGANGAVYMGFSAGGLATMLAAAEAGNTRAYFALDAVDTDNLAAPALDALSVPRFALVGEGSSCNSTNNMLAAYQGKDVRAVRVIGAQHFIFEGDVCAGIKCLACDGGGAEQVEVVRAMSTAFLSHVLDLDAEALSWWDADGARFVELEKAGRVSTLQ
jgi:pimeloyl-ACP methyl ester carboxylesterase